MGSRQKLNSFNALGALVVALIIGGATSSIAVFVIAAVVMLGMMIHSGDIRLSSRDFKRR